MHRNRTNPTRRNTVVGTDVLADASEDDIRLWIALELCLWSDGPASLDSERRRAKQVPEAATWVADWMEVLEHAEAERLVDVASLIGAATEIVTMYWDDHADMSEVMWRSLISGIDDGRLCFDLWAERVLLGAAGRKLGF